MGSEFTPRRQIYGGYEGKNNPSEQDRIVHFMQHYQATEGFNASFLTRWAEATDNETVKGGLRVIQGRESMHVRLLRERLKELGESAFSEVPEARREKETPFYASRELSDYEKLSKVLSIFDDMDFFMQPMVDLIKQIQQDRRSKELLSVILADEIATVEWFKETHQQLSKQ